LRLLYMATTSMTSLSLPLDCRWQLHNPHMQGQISIFKTGTS
jgi:hypothetical protein